MARKTRVSLNGEGKPIVALDIDGTLGDYHGHFLRFAQDWIGRSMPNPKEINPGMRLHKFMGVPLRTYRECKLAYRQGGLKRSMPCYPGASELTRLITRLGGEVWICTTRPYLRLDNIDPDTREWLRRNRIVYDAVLFGEHKYQELYRQAGWRVGMVVDDLPEMCEEAFTIGFTVCIRDQPYNRHIDREHYSSKGGLGVVERVYRCADIQRIVETDIGDWKGRIRG